jgi:hypothetical protein
MREVGATGPSVIGLHFLGAEAGNDTVRRRLTALEVPETFDGGGPTADVGWSDATPLLI